MVRRRRFREEHLQSWRSRLHPGNEQGLGEPSAPPCPPFHAPRFTAGQRLGCHAGWSWPCVPSSAAAHQTRCGEVPWLPRGEIRRFCMAEMEAGPNSPVF